MALIYKVTPLIKKRKLDVNLNVELGRKYLILVLSVIHGLIFGHLRKNIRFGVNMYITAQNMRYFNKYCSYKVKNQVDLLTFSNYKR